MNWSNLFVMLITFVFINNVVLNQFLGMCPFMGVSKKSSSALGMGAAVTFVIVAASLVTYGLYYKVLEPLGLEYMDLITFILVIAALVQLVEMIIKKTSPSLYKALGVYLPLITTNCVVLNVTLNNISFSVPAGKTVALVGRSGSGKSTIANLVTRFYDIDQGEILLDGVNIQDYRLSNLRENCAVVSQQVHLFNDTIANNIAYAAQDKYSREEIIAAAKAAYALEFIEKLPQGFDTVIGENGASLSGGQRQRLAIARALLRNSPVLILDEATSALDTESERAIQSALDELKKDRTVIVIAHRLSTIENADEILVIDHGEIRERGNHKALLEQNGAYKQLHSMQFSG